MKSFRQTIQESSVNDKLDKFVHTKPLSNKRLKQLARNFSTFEDIDLEQWQGYPPPRNSSQVTKNEILNLVSLSQFRDQSERDMVLHDEKVMAAFREYVNKHELEVDLDRVSDLLNQSNPIILSLKRFYKRPRPYTLAKKLGLELSFFPLKTAETPSYPSGHATQGRLAAKLIADEVPFEHRRNLLDIGERIGHTRQIAGAHYASDTEFGHRLGDELYRLATTSREPNLKLESFIKETPEVTMTIEHFLPPSDMKKDAQRTVIYEGAALWGLFGSSIKNKSEWKNMQLNLSYDGISCSNMGEWYQNFYVDRLGPKDLWEDFCKTLGGHMTKLNANKDFIWASIDDYYKTSPSSWEVPVAGKANTADCVLIAKGTADSLLKKCKELKGKKEDEQVRRTVTDGSLVKVDKDIEFYQISLKKDAAPGAARIGKVTKLVAKDIEGSNLPGKIADLAKSQTAVESYYNPTFVYDPNEFLVEGLLSKVSGFLNKVKSVFKRIVKKIISSAKKVTDKLVKKDKKVAAAQGIAKEMANIGMPLTEENLNEFTFRAARKGKPVEYTETLYNHVQDFKKNISGIEKSFKLIETNVNNLNSSKKREFNPIVYTKGDEASQLASQLKQIEPLYKLKPDVKLDGEMYSMFWVVLNVTSNWISYIYVNNVLKQIKEKMDSYDNLEYGLSDAVLSMSGDVSAEAKFGNTALPLVIIKGNGGIDHLGKRDNYSATLAKGLKKTEVYKSDFPILEVDIYRVRSGKEGQLHNTVRIFLLENVEIDGQNVTPVYSNTGFSSKSGSKFSSAAEVQTSRRGYKG